MFYSSVKECKAQMTGNGIHERVAGEVIPTVVNNMY
jgi:hypothetical protein